MIKIQYNSFFNKVKLGNSCVTAAQKMFKHTHTHTNCTCMYNVQTFFFHNGVKNIHHSI